ncbi:MAG: hypothetical protein LBC40_08370, partial [Dysgonamonadaceae bacterium]|nr:hypothetical protein [Dysgonamonadaceae bacterium]
MNAKKIYSYISCYYEKNKKTASGQAVLMNIAEVLSQELKAKGKDRTAKIYRMVARCLTRFAGNEKLMLEDITPALLR